MTLIEALTKNDRPREKLISRGAGALTDVELLAILLGTGIAGRPVERVAGELRAMLDEHKELSFERLCSVPGIGEARAAVLLSAFELRRRSLQPEQVVVRQPKDVVPLVQKYLARQQEHFIVITLNGGNGVIRNEVVTVGLANFCCVHPREVFARAITDRATGVVLVHNHPSGNLEPSSEDISTTRRLVAAASLLGLVVLDHIIVAKSGYRSLRSDDPDLFRSTDLPYSSGGRSARH